MARDGRHPRRLVVLRQPSRTSKSAPCYGTTIVVYLCRAHGRRDVLRSSADSPFTLACTAPLSTSCSVAWATCADIEIGIVLRHNPSSSTSPRGSNGEITDSNSPPNGTSGTIGLQGIDVPAQGLASAAHVGQRVTRWNSSISLPPNGQTRCTAPSSTSCSAATIADIEIGTVLRHTHRRLPRQGGARTSIASLFCFEMCGILVD